jgi:hypothetical protein
MPYRFDAAEMTMTETPEGFLKGVAKVTRTGIFKYVNPDGTIRKELRHPEDVFNYDSLQSLKMIPITELHPAEEYVTAENGKQLAIGFTGENINNDGVYVSIPLSISTKQGVDAIKIRNRKQLSLGYELELDRTPGTFNGDDYDCRQKNIRYNHLALVSKGRAGENVKLNVDSAIELTDDIHKPINKGVSVMPKLRLDGIEYESSQEVINAFEKATAENKTLKSSLVEKDNSITKMRADADTQKAKLDTAEKEVKEMPEKITKAVQDRISLERIALDALPEDKAKDISKMFDADIRKAVILDKFPDAKLDGENDVYIRARFDAACELKGDKGTEDKSAIKEQKAKVLNTDEKKSKVINLDEARQKYIDNMNNAYKAKVE